MILWIKTGWTYTSSLRGCLYLQDTTKWHLNKALLLEKLAFIAVNTYDTQLNIKYKGKWNKNVNVSLENIQKLPKIYALF